MTALGWRLEWLTARARRRLFVLNFAIPLLLVVPVATAGAPPHHAAAVYAVLFVLFGTFGSAIPLLRDAERGFVRRLRLTGAAPAGLLLGRTLAGTCIDAVQLAPSVVIATWGAPLRAVAAVFAVLVATLLLANLLGTWIAAAARSVAEGALFCAVATLLVLHASGVFRTPAPDSTGAAIERLAPYRALHERLLEALGGAAAHGAPPLFAGLIALGALTVALAPRLLGALVRADGRG